ncbi:MAG: glycosyltransferase [Desulfobacterales bacterium]|nr:glycosyltransferase [Desulfobacterales bacterium]
MVDDGSRDHTAAVVRRYDVRLLAMPGNAGQSAARNRGVTVGRRRDRRVHRQRLHGGSPLAARFAAVFQRSPDCAGRGPGGRPRPARAWLDRHETTHSALDIWARRSAWARRRTPISTCPPATCWSARQAFEAVGGLDETPEGR